MLTMRLGLSLCGTCNCGAPVLLVGVFLQCRVLALPRAYCVMCTVYVAACSVRVLVYTPVPVFGDLWQCRLEADELRFRRSWIFAPVECGDEEKELCELVHCFCPSPRREHAMS